MSGNSGTRARVDPGAGKAPLPAPDAAALLRRNAADPAVAERPFLRFDDLVWTHREYVERCLRFADLLRELGPDPAGRLHVGVLLENTPDYLVALGGCAFAGATLVGMNATRRGSHLARDAAHTDVSVLVTDRSQLEVAAPLLDLVPRDRTFPDLEAVLRHRPIRDLGPDGDPPVDTTWCLVFTSGTSSDPKAVICSQRRMLVTGERMRQLLAIEPDDVGYVSMPLFHSNSLMVGVMPAFVAGASVALARRFTASGWLPDVRRYGATWFNYTGKPLSYILATPERPDDADNPMRRGLGNEGAGATVPEFERRFGVDLIEAFGPTEGGIAVLATPDTPAGALGRAGEHVKVVDEDGTELPVGEVGEIVNTAGPGPFEGYYGNDAATTRATRFGWYWTGDLGYLDGDGFLWFAGRTDDWLRVDGENFPAAPIEQALVRHPDVVVAAVYAVPDAVAGDQVMAALVLRDRSAFDPVAFATWLDAQVDLGPKWRPRYLRIADELPTTGTNKILVRQLRREKFRHDLTTDDLWFRERGDDAYRPFTEDDEAALRAEFEAAGRDRSWDL